MSLLLFPSVRSQCDTTFPDGTVCDDSTDYTTMADPEACWKYYECEAGCVTNKVAACHASRGVTAVTCHVSRSARTTRSSMTATSGAPSPTTWSAGRGPARTATCTARAS